MEDWKRELRENVIDGRLVGEFRPKEPVSVEDFVHEIGIIIKERKEHMVEG